MAGTGVLKARNTENPSDLLRPVGGRTGRLWERRRRSAVFLKALVEGQIQSQREATLSCPGRDRRKGAAWPRAPTLVAECDQLLDDLDDYIEAAFWTPRSSRNATKTRPRLISDANQGPSNRPLTCTLPERATGLEPATPHLGKVNRPELPTCGFLRSSCSEALFVLDVGGHRWTRLADSCRAFVALTPPLDSCKHLEGARRICANKPARSPGLLTLRPLRPRE